jgi:hypothetical protein
MLHGVVTAYSKVYRICDDRCYKDIWFEWEGENVTNVGKRFIGFSFRTAEAYS